MGDGYFLLTNLLSEDEKKVITSITAHIERGEKRVGIQQIASENFLSPTSIVKMCKRLGFDGYSELYYYLSRQFDSHGETRDSEPLKNLIDNYSGVAHHRVLRADGSFPAQPSCSPQGRDFPTSSAPISPSGCPSAALWYSITCISTIICCSGMRTICRTVRMRHR